MFDPFTARDFQNALAMWDTFHWDDDAAIAEHINELRESGNRSEQSE